MFYFPPFQYSNHQHLESNDVDIYFMKGKFNFASQLATLFTPERVLDAIERLTNESGGRIKTRSDSRPRDIGTEETGAVGRVTFRG